MQWRGWGNIGGLSGTSFTDLLNQLENFGFFAYVLPFLLVFAVVYAVLCQLKIFKENKGAAVIVALAIGFLSLVGGYVPTFFQIVFANFGIGLSVLLIALILAGVFISELEGKKDTFKWIFFGLGAFIFVVVTFVSFNDYNGFAYGGGWWQQWGGLIVFLIVLAGVVVAVTVAGKRETGTGS